MIASVERCEESRCERDVVIITDRCCVPPQTVLSGDVYTTLSFLVDMVDVSLDLMDSQKSSQHKRSLARLVFTDFSSLPNDGFSCFSADEGGRQREKETYPGASCTLGPRKPSH